MRGEDVPLESTCRELFVGDDSEEGALLGLGRFGIEKESEMKKKKIVKD